MKLSIIIVSYNEKEYLLEAIESCMNQDYDDTYEILIGDDGSNDGSIDLIREYRDKYPETIKYYVMDRGDVSNVIPSLRVSNVIKRGLELSQGEYIMIMSGDDLLCDNQKFRTQVDFLDNNINYASCYMDYKKFWNSGEEEEVIQKISVSRSVFWGSQYVHISCFLFRKEAQSYLLERFSDDTGMIFSIFKAGKTKYIPGIGFGYRQRDKSIMHEADWLELNVLELALMQDVRNAGGFCNSSLARFSNPFVYVFKHRNSLMNVKYKKYIDNCALYSNDIVKQIMDYDASNLAKKIYIRLQMAYSRLMYIYYRFVIRVKLKLKL